MKKDSRILIDFVGGETTGLQQAKNFIHIQSSIMMYPEIRNQLDGANTSSKLSPWLACGCVSVRYVYWEISKFEKQNGGKIKQTQFFIDHLLSRDYFYYYCLRYGIKVFGAYGLLKEPKFKWKSFKNIVFRWRSGTTGMPIVDAIMREMQIQGYISFRARQIAASYLTLDLMQDWRFGAFFYEEQLLDYDCQLNYACWNFEAGINRDNTYLFNVLQLSKQYDPEGHYIKKWCPELS